MGKLGKHDHKLTNILKACIFSLIMLAPLIAIGVKCLYVINNKNAYESYYGETINESENVYKTTNEIKIGSYYYLNTQDYVNSQYDSTNSYNLYVSNLEIYNPGSLNTSEIQSISTYTTYRIYYTTYNNLNTTQFYYYGTDQTYHWLTSLTNRNGTFKFQVDNIGSPSKNYYLFQIEYNDYSYLDNVFYYSIHNLEEQSTFNWVQNTAIYVPINAMCSGLGITESAIPILLCYWSLMTAIYIVFDIIIYLFTKMTHFIGTN